MCLRYKRRVVTIVQYTDRVRNKYTDLYSNFNYDEIIPILEKAANGNTDFREMPKFSMI